MPQIQSPYASGTATVAVGGTTVTVTGILDDTNCIEGDHFRNPATGYETRIIARVDATHFTIPPWRSTAMTAAAYEIYPDSTLRVSAGRNTAVVNQLVQRLKDKGIAWVLPAAYATPTAAAWGADEGQQVYQPTTGKWWSMQSGSWVSIASPSGLQPGANLSDLSNIATARTNLKVAISDDIYGTTQDFNNFTKSGRYIFTAGNDANAPESGRPWYLTVDGYAQAGYVKQTATVVNVTTPIIYTRLCVAGTWGAWAAATSAAENTKWIARAAMLDPSAYTWNIGKSLNLTVPAGKTWYLLNSWFMLLNGSGQPLFQRINSARDDSALALPAGTNLQSSASQTGFAYICDPSLVTSDARYGDAKKLYFDRMNKLSTLGLNEISVSIPAGSAQINVTADFPTDFSNGIVTLVSNHDVSWVGLNSPSGSMNTQNEISDDHQWRAARAVTIPFQQSVFPKIAARAASVTGVASGFSSLAGYAALLYVKLPAGW